MQRKAKDSARNLRPETRRFGNISVTYNFGEKTAVITGRRQQPREILRLHEAGIEVLPGGEIEISGLLRRNESQTYRKARFVFYGNAHRNRKAS